MRGWSACEPLRLRGACPSACLRADFCHAWQLWRLRAHGLARLSDFSCFSLFTIHYAVCHAWPAHTLVLRLEMLYHFSYYPTACQKEARLRRHRRHGRSSNFSLPETAPLPELLNRYHAFVSHSVRTWVANAESNLQLRANVAVAGSLTSLHQQSH